MSKAFDIKFSHKPIHCKISHHPQASSPVEFFGEEDEMVIYTKTKVSE